MINSAVERDHEKRKEKGGCFFQWLTLLPYEATRSIESLLLCLQSIVRGFNMEKAGVFVMPGLHMALTGSFLANQPGRRLWLHALNTILLNFEVMLKMRNFKGRQSKVPFVPNLSN